MITEWRDAWEGGRRAVFSWKYYMRRVKVDSGKNSSCLLASQRQHWLLPRFFCNIHIAHSLGYRDSGGDSEPVSSDVTGPFCWLLGHSRRMSMGEWTHGSSFLFRLHLYHLRRVEFYVLKALRCWCDTQPLKRCHCQTAVIHLFPRGELGT